MVNQYKSLIDGMTWSYSRVMAFSDCPYRFFLRYLLNKPEQPQFYSSYGSFIHKLIELYYAGFFKKEELEGVFLAGFSDAVQGVRPAMSTVEKYIKQGAEYFRSFEPYPYDTIGVELNINFDIGGYPFTGFIDFLGERDGKMYLIDAKSRDLSPRSNRKKPTKKDEELDLMLRQLYIYSAGVEQVYGKTPDFLCFSCFRTGVFIEEPFKQEAYEEAKAWIVREIERIKGADDFYPQLDFFYCRYICGFGDICEYNEMAKGAG